MTDSKVAKKIEVVPCPDMPSMFSVFLDGQRFVGDPEDESIWCGTEAEADAVKSRDRWWAKRDIYLKNKAQYVARNKEKIREAARKEMSTPHYRARYLLKLAVSRGDVNKPSCCSGCKQPIVPAQLHGHHEDYDKPLDVKWLCQKCHGLAHRRAGVAKVELPRKEQYV